MDAMSALLPVLKYVIHSLIIILFPEGNSNIHKKVYFFKKNNFIFRKYKLIFRKYKLIFFIEILFHARILVAFV